MTSNSLAISKKSKNSGVCSINFLKYLLFIFTFVFFIAGCAVLAFGIWTVIEKHAFVSLLSSSTYVSIAYLLIISGCVVFVVTIVGCVGVWREDRWALLIYTFMLLLIFLLEAVSGVLAYVYEEQLRVELETNLNQTFLTTYMIDEQRTKEIDTLQKQYKCCGALDYEDWQYSTWLKTDKSTKNTAPESCCITESRFCAVRSHPSNIHEKSCIGKLEVYIKDHLIILGAVGLGVCVVQVFGLILSCCLYVKLKRYEDNLY